MGKEDGREREAKEYKGDEMVNADLVKILELRLAEARAGTVTDVIAVFGGPGGGYAFTALDDGAIPNLIGNFDVFKVQLIGMHLQRMQQRSTGGGIVRATAVPKIPDEILKKMTKG